jgi:hypothetical protein
MGPFTPQTQDTTVYTLAAQLMADAANDGDRERIDRALDLVATVERTPIRGLFLVPSASTAGGCYHVRHGLCDCPDAQRRDALRCKHAAAVQLFQLVERADAEAGDPTIAITVEPADEAIPFALTPAALTFLGEPCEIEPRTAGGTITVLPLSPRAQALRAELYPDERPRPALRLVSSSREPWL